MTKITEVTTNTEKVLARVLRGCLDERFYGIYTGGPEVSRVFPSLSFDKILFTGGTETGRKIATAAGPNIVTQYIFFSIFVILK
jgi:coniferyl-aldehyde dehydrogenase